jgi:hypothetical protein
MRRLNVLLVLRSHVVIPFRLPPELRSVLTHRHTYVYASHTNKSFAYTPSRRARGALKTGGRGGWVGMVVRPCAVAYA